MKMTWKQIALASVSLLGLAACAQKQAASVETKGDIYYGRYERLRGNTEMPLYSDNNRAVQDPSISEKYVSSTHEYSIPAAVPAVEVQELDTPTPASVAERKVTYTKAQPKTSKSAPFAKISAEEYMAAKKERALQKQQAEAEALAEKKSAEPKAVASQKSLKNDLSDAALAPLPDKGRQDESVVQEKSDEETKSQVKSDSASFIWPVQGKVVSSFGPKKNGLANEGINIAAEEGEPIWAAAKGEVIYSGNELKGYGNMVIIKHDGGWMTAYAHGSNFVVKKGDLVGQGDLIGYVGSTGNVKSSQLHFSVKDGRHSVDPETLLPQRMASAE